MGVLPVVYIRRRIYYHADQLYTYIMDIADPGTQTLLDVAGFRSVGSPGNYAGGVEYE